MVKQWFILRCKNADTLPLLRSLTRAGLTVWTPVERVTKRVPRANVKRKLDNPLLPSYLFVTLDNLTPVIGITEEPVSQHRPFRVFFWHSKLPLIDDATFAPLRELEDKARLRERRDDSRGFRFTRGQAVTLTEGSFAGLSGEVEQGGSNYTTVRIQGFSMPLKIANYHLLQNEGNSAKAAA